MLRLNLGCGHKKLPGYVNVDMPNPRGSADLELDLTRPLPYGDSTVDEIVSYHVIEHFDRWLVDDILKDWSRVLKPGGTIALECPCLDKILGIFQYGVEHQRPMPERLTLWALYGDPNYREPAMTHKWCYSVGELTELMEQSGLTVTLHEPQTHIKVRDMRLEGVKADL